MKKSIIALAVAGAMTVPMIAQADATLFGEARWDVSKAKSGKLNSDISRIRFGVKGEETMDSGLTAGFFLRFDGTGDTSTNKSVDTQKAALFIAGDFGKVVLGQADSPAASVEDRVNYVSVTGDEFGVVGDEFGHSGIAYQSNDISGFKFAVGTGNLGQDDSLLENGMGASVSYDTDTFGVTVGAGKAASTLVTAAVGATPAVFLDGESHSGISAEYKFSQGAVGASMTKQDQETRVTLAGKYSIDMLTLAAQIDSNTLKSKIAGVKEVKKRATSVSASYKLGGNATASIALVNFNKNAKVATGDNLVKARYHVSF